MTSVRSVIVGIGAGFRVPRWLGRDRLDALLAGSAGSDIAPTASDASVKVAHRTIRLLSMIPRSPVRATCLYRSVAECLVLRHYGVRHRLRVGARRDAAAATGVHAHAWVEREAQSGSDDFTPFERTEAEDAHLVLP